MLLLRLELRSGVLGFERCLLFHLLSLNLGFVHGLFVLLSLPLKHHLSLVIGDGLALLLLLHLKLLKPKLGDRRGGCLVARFRQILQIGREEGVHRVQPEICSACARHHHRGFVRGTRSLRSHTPILFLVKQGLPSPLLLVDGDPCFLRGLDRFLRPLVGKLVLYLEVLRLAHSSVLLMAHQGVLLLELVEVASNLRELLARHVSL